jgi:hypothetical protein
VERGGGAENRKERTFMRLSNFGKFDEFGIEMGRRLTVNRRGFGIDKGN